MLKTMTALACALAAGAALAAPAAAQEGETAARADDRCVTVRPVSGYSVIDDRHLLLNAGPSRHYLVTTRTRCSGLRFGARVGLSFGDNARLCRPFVEYVIPDDGWRCPIDAIVEVESEDEARRLAARDGEGDG